MWPFQRSLLAREISETSETSEPVEEDAVEPNGSHLNEASEQVNLGRAIGCVLCSYASAPLEENSSNNYLMRYMY